MELKRKNKVNHLECTPFPPKVSVCVAVPRNSSADCSYIIIWALERWGHLAIAQKKDEKGKEKTKSSIIHI